MKTSSEPDCKQMLCSFKFTLIELLIVIAIIAILAGMLLPALNSTRQQAKTIQCVNLKKQMVTTLLMYADDNKEALLLPSLSSLPSSGCTSYAAYLIKLNYLRQKKSFICPLVDKEYVNANNWYSWSVFGVRSSYRPITENGNVWYSLREVKSPSHFILVADSYFSPASIHLYKSSYLLYDGASTNHAMAFWHKRKAIPGILDGHVIPVDKSGLVKFQDENSWSANSVSRMKEWW